MTKPKIGVFSGYDPRPWVMEDCAEGDIRTLENLVNRLREDGRYDVVYPGASRDGWDKLCYTTQLCQEYAQELFEAGVVGLVNVHQTWTFPQTSQMVLASYEQLLKNRDATAKPRLVMASIQDTTVPGMVSGMATAGAFNQTGGSFGRRLLAGAHGCPGQLHRAGGERAEGKGRGREPAQAARHRVRQLLAADADDQDQPGGADQEVGDHVGGA
ncbi:MAG: hypothetical protein ACYS5W_00695 [Planctomycetota bacterium]|jgi:hypothetical protein